MIHVPIRLLHGLSDADVPYQLSVRLAEHVEAEDVEVILIKDGDHRLSKEKELKALMQQIDNLVARTKK